MPDEESPSDRQERWQRQQEKEDHARRLNSYMQRLKLYAKLWNRRRDFMDSHYKEVSHISGD